MEEWCVEGWCVEEWCVEGWCVDEQMVVIHTHQLAMHTFRSLSRPESRTLCCPGSASEPHQG